MNGGVPDDDKDGKDGECRTAGDGDEGVGEGEETEAK